jgi:hypothetical protein
MTAHLRALGGRVAVEVARRPELDLGLGPDLGATAGVSGTTLEPVRVSWPASVGAGWGQIGRRQPTWTSQMYTYVQLA